MHEQMEVILLASNLNLPFMPPVSSSAAALHLMLCLAYMVGCCLASFVCNTLLLVSPAKFSSVCLEVHKHTAYRHGVLVNVSGASPAHSLLAIDTLWLHTVNTDTIRVVSKNDQQQHADQHVVAHQN